MRAFEIFDHYFADLGVTPLDLASGVSPGHEDPLRVIIAPTVMDALKHVHDVAQAFLKREPMLLITIEGQLKCHGCGDEHIELLEIMEPITKYNTFVSHREQIEMKFTGACASTITSRVPAHMIMPIDLLHVEITEPKLWELLTRHGRPQVPVTAYNWPSHTENA